MNDPFRGDTASLIDNIKALLEMDAEGALKPRGLGGHARTLLTAAAARLTLSPEARDREADRQRFSDPAFNRWLDEGISDAGHTVWDMVGNTADAWQGWSNRPFYVTGKAEPLLRGYMGSTPDGGIDDHDEPAPEARETAEPACEYCGGSGDVHGLDGEWRGVCHCPAGDKFRAAPPAVEKPAEPVGTLTVSKFRGHLENVDFDYYGSLPPGTYKLAVAAPVSQAEPVPPLDVQEAARRFVANDYRGPLASAKRVFDWVHSLKPPFADPMFQAEPSTSHEEKGQG